MTCSTPKLRTFGTTTTNNVGLFSNVPVSSERSQELTTFGDRSNLIRASQPPKRIAMSNVNYEQSYPLQTTFRSPARTTIVRENALTGNNEACNSGNTLSKQPCSTFRQSPRKSSVIRIDAREYSDLAEQDLPAPIIPRAMNPLTNYPSMCENSSLSQTCKTTMSSTGHLKRNISKTSLYAPPSISHMIATTTPPPRTSKVLQDLPPPPISSTTGVGSPSFRRQHSSGNMGMRVTYEYTMAGSNSTIRRSQPTPNQEDPICYQSAFSNTLPYHQSTLRSTNNTTIPARPTQGEEYENYKNTNIVTSCALVTKESPTQCGQQQPQHVTFAAPAVEGNNDTETNGKGVKIDRLDSNHIDLTSKKENSTFFYQNSSNSDRELTKDKKRRIDKKSLWCLVAMLLIMLLFAIAFLVYFANGYGKNDANVQNSRKVENSGSVFSTPRYTRRQSSTPKLAKPISTIPPFVRRRPSGNKYCLTQECIQSAAIVMKKMNKSVEPCEDFYDYACGGWVTNNYMPADRGNYGVVSQITDANDRVLYEALIRPGRPSELSRDIRGRNTPGNITLAEIKTKAFFRSCMDVRSINKQGSKPMLDMVNDMGGWQTENTRNITRPDLNDLLYIIQGQQGISVFFSMSVHSDDNNNSILRIDQDGITLPDEGFYQFDPQQRVVKAYKQLISNILNLLNFNNATKIVDDIYAFEKELAKIKIARSAGLLTRNDKDDSMVTIRELGELCPQIEWYRLLQQIVRKTSLSYHTKVMVKAKYLLGNLSHLLSESDHSTIINYMLWRAVVTKANYMSAPFRDAMREFSKALYGSRPESPRWKECLFQVTKHFRVAAGVMFAREAFTAASKRQVEEMVRNIKNSFRENLHSVEWMDEITKQRARNKLRAMNAKVGYEEELFNNPNLLNDLYKFQVGDRTYLKNILNSQHHKITQKVENIFQDKDQNDWDLWTQTMNAYYNPKKNQVLFPAGLLQSPLYNPIFPMSINYGAIGSIIGHELTHGYDNIGEQFDKFGNNIPWWTNTSSASFRNKSECILKTYANYHLGNLYVNSVKTMEENIADIAGLKIAYKAFKRWSLYPENRQEAGLKLPGLELTNDQLFFISFAQTWCMKRLQRSYHVQFSQDHHSPERFRVQGSVSQFPEFAKTFRCRDAAPMNPPNRCSVW